jgi:hemolysin D
MNGVRIMKPVTEAVERTLAAFERNDEREFLPAALEVLETPPSPLGRLMGLLIVLFFVVAALWAFFGKVDILATAPGRVLPSGEVKVIQPLDTARVRSIRVQNGDQVKAGELLIELDPTDPTADRDRLTHDLMQQELDVARLTALKSAAAGGPAGAFVAPATAAPDDLAQTQSQLAAQTAAQGARLANLDQQISQKRAEVEEVGSEIDKLNAVLPMLQEKERMREDLQARGYGTTFALIDAKQQLVATQHDLNVQGDRKAQSEAAVNALQRQRQQTVSQFSADVLDNLDTAETKRNELSKELVKAQQKVQGSQLRAPVDGTVEQLTVHTIGGVVTAAQRLLTIVPNDKHLMIEAELANRDIGFVRAGQAVAVKVETFNFTRYGLLPGRVISVSRTAVVAGDAPAVAGMEPGATTAPPSSPRYVARIALDQDSMMIDGRQERLLPGMAVTAEIKTGRRSIIDYLFSPIARTTQNSLHER